MDSVRVDRWLYAARIFKTRTAATSACSGGHVRVNEGGVKPHHALRVGDEVRAQAGKRLRILGVRKLADKRLGPAAAGELYDDRSPPPVDTRLGSAQRPRGAGRPTKRDRRALQQLKRRH